MKNNGQHTVLFNMEEVLQATHDKSIREGLKKRIADSQPQEEILKGVKEFLEDHDYDFDQLADFLATSEKDIERRASEVRTESKSNRRFLRAGAATVLIILGITATLYMFQDSPHEVLYTQHYHKPVGLPVTMSASPSMNKSKVFNESMNLYKDQQYQRAIDGFISLYKKETNNDTLNYYIGVTYLELDEPESAITFLSKGFDTKEFQYHASFYLALAHLKTGAVDKCRTLLEAIVNNPKHPHLEQSKKLLSDFSKL